MTTSVPEHTGPSRDGSFLPDQIDAAYVAGCFPGMQGVTFLDHAAASPLPRPSIDALVAMAERLGSTDSPDALAQADHLRIEIGKLINAEPSGVALTRSTAHGISILANGLHFASGDNVVVVEGDYPTAIYPWMARQQRDGLEVRFVRPGDAAVTPALVMAETDERTRVVCLAEVMFVTGYRLDLASIGAACRDRGILFCVDAMQSVGAFDIDVVASHIDVLSSGGVKWLLGPNGVSFCWMRHDLIQRLPPLIPGALTVANRMDFTNIDPVWAEDAHRFEETWLPSPVMAALETSIQMARHVGLEEIGRLVRANGRHLAGSLAEMGAKLHGPWPRSDGEMSGIVSFSHDRATAEHIAHHLTEDQVRFSRRGNSIRLSPHYYNSVHDLECALQAVETAIAHPT